MKKTITILSALLFTGFIFGQTYNAPESVEFDYANNRWLIANPGAGNILSRNSQNGALTVFATGSNSPHGLEIVNDTLYSCEGGNIHLYNVNTGASIASIALGATFLNGITHDNNGNLFATDFSAKKIYRVNTATRHFNLFASTTTTPNGIIFDQPNNRCVFVTWNANAPIMQVTLNDSLVSQVVATTLGSCDGIAKDGAGNYYISSWTGNKITRYDNTFSTSTAVVTTGLSSPADIFYNTVTDTLGVPNSSTSVAGNNTKYYYFGTAIGINEESNSNSSLSVTPNPISEKADIAYEIKEEGFVSIQLFDVKGQLVKTILNENQSKGKHNVTLDKTGIAAGNYILNINSNNSKETKKLIVK